MVLYGLIGSDHRKNSEKSKNLHNSKMDGIFMKKPMSPGVVIRNIRPWRVREGTPGKPRYFFYKMKKYEIPNVELNAGYFNLMRRVLNKYEQADVIAALVDAITEGEAPPLTDLEWPFFESLYEVAAKRADAWERQHKNFRENNPMKKNKIEND